MVIQIISAVLGSLGYALLYNIRGIKLLYTALGGAIAWGMYLLASMFTDHGIVFGCIAGAAAVTLYSEILARILKTPTTTFLTAAIITLVPGGSLYYAMSGLVEGNIDLFLAHGRDALVASLSLAAGVMIVASAAKLINTVRQKKRT